MRKVSKDWTRRAVLKSAGALALLPLCTPAAGQRPLQLVGLTMGTYYRVRIQSWPAHLYLPKLKRAIQQVLAQTEALMSSYRANSELSQFNRSSTTIWQKVSVLTSHVVAAGLIVQEQSAGAFNTAAAPLVDYWGFGPRPAPLRRYDTNAPPQLMARVHAAGIESKPGFIRKANAGAALDLNGIAKGNALDRVAELLQQAGIRDYLVEIGGEIRVAGIGPDAKGWRIGIDHPASKTLRLALNTGAIATSGDYVDYFEQDGKRICHILDPRHGGPVEHDLGMVSVVSDTAMQADAWATALFVLGPQDGWSYALERGLTAMFSVRRGQQFTTFMTPNFRRLLLNFN